MSAQAASAETAELRGPGVDVAVTPQNVQLNGVPAVDRQSQIPWESGVFAENPNSYDPNPGTIRQSATGNPSPGQMFLGNVEPPYGNLQDASTNVSQGAREQGPTTPARREPRSATTPTRSPVRVQEFYTAEQEEGIQAVDQGGVRWMARFTEFLRTTASRGVTGVDRMLDNLGFMHPNVSMIPTDPRMQRSLSSPVRFSPPEQLPEQREQVGPPVPLSWASHQQNAPLFSPAQMAQLRQAQRDHPHIYGYPAASEGESDRSSRLQAEVQRQLEEYTNKYQTQMQGLLQEVEALRAERRHWQLRVADQGDPQLLRPDPTVPQGNPQHQPVLHPVQLAGEQKVPQNDPRDAPSGSRVPQGELPSVPQGESGNGRERLREQRDLMREDAKAKSREGEGVRLQGVETSRSSQKLDDPTVPRGNPQHQPRGPEFYSQARGQESGPSMSQARGQESGPSTSQACGQESEKEVSKMTGSGHGEPHDPRPVTEPPTAQQWLGNTPAPDAMTLIAGGVAQLQAAMLKQMSVDKGGERTPETVKPGTSTLPMLPPVRSESASVDLLDWLELIEAPMSDLSDGSASWWKQVRASAATAYDGWVVSGPIDRLGIVPTAGGELEEGKWSRVNSRAASMILTALDESIRSELVSRRMTGSVTSIIFRLTLYQPGGEEEKYRTLQQLQNPPKEVEPSKAVEALRAWNRWLRRCRELNLQVPDPSLLVRGLHAVVRGVLERNSEASFRTNLVRSNLKIDSNPTMESVEKYYKHLMGECESLATAIPTTSTSTVTTAPTTTRQDPKLKPVKPDTRTTPSTPPAPSPPTRTPATGTSGSGGEEEKDKRKETPCRFFGKTYKGCARVGKCPFRHSWDSLEKERPSRCLACGGKHMAKDCPNKKQAGTPSGSGTPEAKGQPTTPRQQTSSSTTSPPATKTVRIDDNPEVEHISGRTEATQGEASSVDLKQVLSDVRKILKAMSSTSLKKFAVEEKEDWRQAEPERDQRFQKNLQRWPQWNELLMRTLTRACWTAGQATR